jgi:uncharacterized protein
VELTNTFTVDLPVAQTWDVLLDLGRVIPCLPGAAVLGFDGENFEGAVKIKVGPISSQYKGAGRFVEKDQANRRAVIEAEGKDVGGQGNAKATITATLSEQGSGTAVHVLTDLALSGRAANFGRGIIADVSSKILGQFAKNLEVELARGGTAGAEAAAPTKPASIDDVEPLDVMGSMGGVVAKYAVPGIAALVALVALILALTRGGRRAAGNYGGPTIPRLDRRHAPHSAAPVVINLIFPSSSGRNEAPGSAGEIARVLRHLGGDAEAIR